MVCNDRCVLLHERHASLLVSSAASQNLDLILRAYTQANRQSQLAR